LSTTAATALAVEPKLAPRRITALSWVMSLLARMTDWSGLLWSSSNSTCTGWPSIPPAALICSTASWMPSRVGTPLAATGPLRDSTAPIT
jgi:hypothetical protein